MWRRTHLASRRRTQALEAAYLASPSAAADLAEGGAAGAASSSARGMPTTRGAASSSATKSKVPILLAAAAGAGAYLVYNAPPGPRVEARATFETLPAPLAAASVHLPPRLVLNTNEQHNSSPRTSARQS